MVEGGETLSLLLNGNMYPTMGMRPVPIAGLTIGRGAIKIDPRRSFFFLSVFLAVFSAGSGGFSADAGAAAGSCEEPLGGFVSTKGGELGGGGASCAAEGFNRQRQD